MGDIQQDPSMEEILASIKRVIRDDGRIPGQARTPRRGPRVQNEAAPAVPEEDILELDDPVDQDNGLISDDAAAASRQSLAALSAMRSAPASEGGALDALVRDMLRPILKDWLDQHLPQIVEDLVTREIARITGRKF